MALSLRGTIFAPGWPGASEAEARSLDPWDTLVVNGRAFPGLAQVSGRLRRRTDKKRAAGTNGASLTHLGYDPAEVDVVLRMWTQTQLDEWQVLVALLQPPPRAGAPAAVRLQHPAIDIMKLGEMYPEEVGLLERSGTPGVYEVRLRFTERRKVSSKNAQAPVKATNLKPGPEAFTHSAETAREEAAAALASLPLEID